MSVARNLTAKILIAVGITTVISVAGVYRYVAATTEHSAVEAATAEAISAINRYRILRSYYTRAIVDKVTDRTDLRVSADHMIDTDAIPLPATVIHDLSSLFADSEYGFRLKLYSEHPFPNRQSRTVDSFAKEALEWMKDRPDEPYVKTSLARGQELVRVAVSDKMAVQACVDCHNSHPASPKTDWKLGDVRGVLEVEMPIAIEMDGNRRATRGIIWVLSVVLGVALILIGVTAGIVASTHARQLEQLNRRLVELARIDSLTKLSNRRVLFEELGLLIRIARRTGDPLSVVIMDVDHFKMYNDRFGHLAGDDVLRQVASILRDASRESDCVARYGGEEFAVVLSNTDREGGIEFAERTRRTIERTTWPNRPVTASFGVATYFSDQDDLPVPDRITQIVADADAALYRSKEAGRNKATHDHSDTG